VIIDAAKAARVEDEIAADTQEQAVIVPLRKWKRKFEAGTPADALTWKTSKQRSKRMFAWRVAVMNKFDSSVRVVRVAWLLDCLCWKEGFAYATDSYISKTLGTPLNKVQQALAELEKAGAIIRASSFVDGTPQRRIWPSTKIIPPTAGGIHTPRDDRGDTPHGGGTDSIEHKTTPRRGRITSTQQAARQERKPDVGKNMRTCRSRHSQISAERQQRDGAEIMVRSMAASLVLRRQPTRNGLLPEPSSCNVSKSRKISNEQRHHLAQ
jgi:hypothetical protein